ncbi:extracellular calcium-sensing receptor-like [Callorhinchus milii]|uniref:extracellular calcium-sensing receptor-like n=1 Tax=Callorhinchus milii TaxID=7868 RepID=UPI001C3FAF4A|nr:extracellular calcium-sensing receptor-like [Callorhinchus milii]
MTFHAINCAIGMNSALFWRCLLLITSVLGEGKATCILRGDFNLPGLLQDGDVDIGGLFPMHYRAGVTDLAYQHKLTVPTCQSFDFRGFRWAQTMIFAIEEINKDLSLLPNITLGYKIYDSCATHVQALRSTLTILSGPEVIESDEKCPKDVSMPAIIGDSGSSQSLVVARTIGPFRIPMVSYFSTCSCLSNRREFPTFFRTIPNDDYQVKAIVQLVKHFGWTWVAAISEDDDYGRFGIQALTEELEKLGVCMAFYEMIPKVYSHDRILHIVERIRMSSAKVIVAFSGDGEIFPLMQEIVKQNITGVQWIASEAWITTPLFSPSLFYDTLGGTIGFAIRRADIPELKEFLLTLHPSLFPGNALVKEFWETLFSCSFDMIDNTPQQANATQPQCSGLENIDADYNMYSDVTQLRISYNVYKAVYAIAHSLHSLILCENGAGPFENKTCGNISHLKPWQLQYYLQEVSFTDSLGEVVDFDENGDPIASYDIINWKQGADGSVQFVTVGHYDASEGSGHKLVLKEEDIIWNRGQNKVPQSMCTISCPPGTRKGVREGEPICCFDCLPCDDGEISNQTDSIKCTKCPLDFWSNHERVQCIPKEIEYLSYEETMGIMLTVIALCGACITKAVAAIFFCYRKTVIVRANNSELSFYLLFSLTLCFLCSVSFIGKPTHWSCMIRHTAFAISFTLCISCVLAKTVVVLIVFKATLPNNNTLKWFGPLQQRAGIFISVSVQVLICIIWLVSSPPFPSKNTQVSNAKNILECDVGSVVDFCCVFGYIGFLSAMCFILAFLARKLPDNFNEAKYITFSMLIFFVVWIAFIPAYVSSPGKYTVAVEIFPILSSSLGMLICIFAPKCYILLLKPETNTKKHLMGRESLGNKL